MLTIKYLPNRCTISCRQTSRLQWPLSHLSCRPYVGCMRAPKTPFIDYWPHISPKVWVVLLRDRSRDLSQKTSYFKPIKLQYVTADSYLQPRPMEQPPRQVEQPPRQAKQNPKLLHSMNQTKERFAVPKSKAISPSHMYPKQDSVRETSIGR